jgi:hypothetical protein
MQIKNLMLIFFFGNNRHTSKINKNKRKYLI